MLYLSFPNMGWETITSLVTANSFAHFLWQKIKDHPQLGSPVTQEDVHMPPVLPSYQQQGEQDRVFALAAQLKSSIPKFLQHEAEGLMSWNTKLYRFAIKLTNIDSSDEQKCMKFNVWLWQKRVAKKLSPFSLKGTKAHAFLLQNQSIFPQERILITSSQIFPQIES